MKIENFVQVAVDYQREDGELRKKITIFDLSDNQILDLLENLKKIHEFKLIFKRDIFNGINNESMDIRKVRGKSD